MIGTELVWSKIKSYGKALIITAAAAVINELIAVIAAKKGFEKAGENHYCFHTYIQPDRENL